MIDLRDIRIDGLQNAAGSTYKATHLPTGVSVMLGASTYRAVEKLEVAIAARDADRVTAQKVATDTNPS